MATKTQLSNNLLGKYVIALYGLAHVLSGIEQPAVITAAWLAEGSVKVALVDPKGAIKEVYLQSLRIFENLPSALERIKHEKFLYAKLQATMELIQDNPDMSGAARADLNTKVIELEQALQH